MCQARGFGRCTSFGTLPKTTFNYNNIDIKAKEESEIVNDVNNNDVTIQNLNIKEVTNISRFFSSEAIL